MAILPKNTMLNFFQCRFAVSQFRSLQKKLPSPGTNLKAWSEAKGEYLVRYQLLITEQSISFLKIARTGLPGLHSH